MSLYKAPASGKERPQLWAGKRLHCWGKAIKAEEGPPEESFQVLCRTPELAGNHELQLQMLWLPNNRQN